MEANNNEGKKEEKPSCCTRFRTSMRNAGHYLYNSDTKEVMGRSGLSWVKILTFYIGFYAVLAGFWAICMVVFIKTLDPMQPTMQKLFSMMKDNPGMNFEPVNDTSATLIYFDPKNATEISETYTNRLKEIYEGYVNLSTASTLKRDCTVIGSTDDTACRFDMSLLGNSCTPENNFGYTDGRPCVLLRINRVFRWEPNTVTFDDLTSCNHTENSTKPECAKQVEFMALHEHTRSVVAPGYISVSCKGENDGDVDNIKKVTFYPAAGFPAYFFPYMNQPNYTSPIVMAQFDVIPGRVSMILCQIWTNEIIHDQNDLQGSIHLELFVGP